MSLSPFLSNLTAAGGPAVRSAGVADAAAYLLGVAVFAGAVGAAVMLGRRLRNDARRPTVAPEPSAELGPSEITARHVFRVLQERRIATVEQLAAMSPRERQLLFDSVARRVTPIVGMPAVASPEPAPARLAAVEAPLGVVHCPACGVALPAAHESSRLLAQCAGCGRRFAARREGGRVVVTVDDRRDSGSGPAVPRSPQRPSGGSPATRRRS